MSWLQTNRNKLVLFFMAAIAIIGFILGPIALTTKIGVSFTEDQNNRMSIAEFLGSAQFKAYPSSSTLIMTANTAVAGASVAIIFGVAGMAISGYWLYNEYTNKSYIRKDNFWLLFGVLGGIIVVALVMGSVGVGMSNRLSDADWFLNRTAEAAGVQ